jgi:hypothetical protein
MKIDLLLPRGGKALKLLYSIMNINTISLALVGKTNKGIKTHTLGGWDKRKVTDGTEPHH